MAPTPAVDRLDPAPGRPQLIRPGFSRTIGVLCFAVPAAWLVLALLTPPPFDLIIGAYLPIVIVVAALTLLGYVRVQLVIDADGVTIVNPLRTHRASYAAITSIQVKYALRLSIDRKPVMVLAAPESSGTALDMARASSIAVGPVLLGSLDAVSASGRRIASGANAAALAIEQQKKRRGRDQHPESSRIWNRGTLVIALVAALLAGTSAVWQWA